MRPSDRVARAAELAEIKRILKDCDGNVQTASIVLGLKYRSLSRRLNADPLRRWWIRFKDERRRRNQRMRKQRWREGVERRMWGEV